MGERVDSEYSESAGVGHDRDPRAEDGWAPGQGGEERRPSISLTAGPADLLLLSLAQLKIERSSLRRSVI
jgi:hypothetical protein